MNYEPKAVVPADFAARHSELCAERDRVNAKNAPVEAELAAVNAKCDELRLKALQLAEKIDANRGGAAWLALKKEIGTLARALGGRR